MNLYKVTYDLDERLGVSEEQDDQWRKKHFGNIGFVKFYSCGTVGLQYIRISLILNEKDALFLALVKSISVMKISK